MYLRAVLLLAAGAGTAWAQAPQGPLAPSQEQQARALAGTLAQAQQVILSVPDLVERLKTVQAELDACKHPSEPKPEVK